MSAHLSGPSEGSEVEEGGDRIYESLKSCSLEVESSEMVGYHISFVWKRKEKEDAAGNKGGQGMEL